MASILDTIPFYGAYTARRAQNEQAGMDDLKQAAALQAIYQSIQQGDMQRQQMAQGLEDRARAERVRQAIAALPPEKRTRENVLPILMEGANPQQIAGMLPAKAEEGFTLGPDQTRYDRAGNVVAVAPGKSAPEGKAPPMRTIYDGKDTVQQELQPDGTWKEVGRGQRQTDRDQQPQPITPVTIVDPKDPTKTLVVDGRTGRVIGAAPKETPQGKREADARFKMRGLGDAIQEADDILSGVKRDADGNVTRAPLPTSSGIGKGYDAAAGFFGASPSGAAEAQRLKVVAGVLTSKVPRMEGPQSNLDVELYKQMAADAGNEALPIPRRLAAVREMKRLYGKYEHLQGDAGATQPPGAPAAPSPAQRAPGGPVEGQTATNRATGQKLIFRGGKWQPM